MKFEKFFLCFAVFTTMGTLAQNLMLDQTFGTNGFVNTQLPLQMNESIAVAVQDDGKILLCGTSPLSMQYSVSRFNSDGSIDTSFGNAGSVQLTFGYNPNFIRNALKIREDGKILLLGQGGYFDTPQNVDFFVARLNFDGSMDNSFGVNGVARVDFFGFFDDAKSLVILPDNKIVVAGNVDFTQYSQEIGLVRLLPDGQIDNSFGINGKVTYNSGVIGLYEVSYDEVIEIKLQSDQTIILAGYTAAPNEPGLHNFFAMRLKQDGMLDESFGTGGQTITDLGYSDYCTSLQINSQDEIYVFGYGQNETAPYKRTVGCKLTPDGLLDTDFGMNGIVEMSMGSSLSENYNSFLQADGKILCEGLISDTVYDVFFLRYNTDGSLDDTFGTNGISLHEPLTEYGSVLFGMAAQPDGKIVYCGRSGYSYILTRFEYSVLSTENFGEQYFSIYPNPFCDKLQAVFDVKENQILSFTLIDVLGKKIRLTENEFFFRGRHIRELNVPPDLSKGVYYFEMQIGPVVRTVKLVK